MGMWGRAPLFHFRPKTLQPSTGFDLSAEIFVTEKEIAGLQFSLSQGRCKQGLPKKKKKKLSKVLFVVSGKRSSSIERKQKAYPCSFGAESLHPHPNLLNLGNCPPRKGLTSLLCILDLMKNCNQESMNPLPQHSK